MVDNRTEIKRLNEEGKTDREIGEMLGMSRNYVTIKRLRMGLKPQGNKGDRTPPDVKARAKKKYQRMKEQGEELIKIYTQGEFTMIKIYTAVYREPLLAVLTATKDHQREVNDIIDRLRSPEEIPKRSRGQRTIVESV